MLRFLIWMKDEKRSLKENARSGRAIAPPAQGRQVENCAQQIGADGMHLLHALEQPQAPAELKDVASVELLRQVWQQYYDLAGGKANWRAGPQESSGEGIIRSPYV